MTAGSPRPRILPALLAMAAVTAISVTSAPAQQRSTPPVIVVGVADDRPPYAYLGEDGAPAGFGVDVMRAMARVMGFEVGFVSLSASAARETLERGSVDVVAALPQTPERLAWAHFSAPLLELEASKAEPGGTTGLCFAVRRGNHALRDRLDQGLETLRTNGQFQKLYDEHIGIARMQQPGSPLGGWLLPIVVVFLLLFLAGFALWLRSAPRQGARPGEPPGA